MQRLPWVGRGGFILLLATMILAAISVSGLAHYNGKVYISGGPVTYVTGHSIVPRTDCPDSWNQNHSDKITVLSASSVRFYWQNTYVYNLQRSGELGIYKIIDSTNSNNTAQWLDWWFEPIQSGTNYPITTGHTVGTAPNLRPYTYMWVYHTGGPFTQGCGNQEGGWYFPA